MSLRTKLVLLVFGLTTALLGGLGLSLASALQRWTVEVVDEELARRVEVLVHEAHVEDEGKIELDDDDDLAVRGLPFRIEDEHGALLVGSEGWPNAPASGPGTVTVETPTGAQVRITSVAFTPRNGALRSLLRVAAPLTAVSRVAQRFRQGLLVALLLAAALSVVGAALLAQWFLAPIRKLVRETDGLEARSLSGRLETAGLDPALRQLALAFNGLLARVESVLQGQRDFIARASHALRTPLSSILTQAEVTLQREREAERYRGTLESIAQTTRDASRLADGLLVLARAEATATAAPKEAVVLTELGAAFQRLFGPRAEALGLRFECEVPEGLIVRVARARLQEALDALLDNALRYTPRGGLVRFQARREGPRVVLEVCDDGPGIDPDERTQVFARFYRGAAAASTGQPGSGLGLALVKSLLDAEGASVEILSAPGGGTRILIALPPEALSPSKSPP